MIYLLLIAAAFLTGNMVWIYVGLALAVFDVVAETVKK